MLLESCPQGIILAEECLASMRHHRHDEMIVDDASEQSTDDHREGCHKDVEEESRGIGVRAEDISLSMRKR